MNDSMRRAGAILLLILGGAALWWAGNGAPASASANDAMIATLAAARERAAASDSRLKGASRFEAGGWIYVHLEGDPGTVGYQHGYLLSPEIEDGFAAVSAGMMHSTKRDWEFFRKAAHEMLCRRSMRSTSKNCRASSKDCARAADRNWMWMTSWRSMHLRSYRTTTCPG